VEVAADTAEQGGWYPLTWLEPRTYTRCSIQPCWSPELGPSPSPSCKVRQKPLLGLVRPLTFKPMAEEQPGGQQLHSHHTSHAAVIRKAFPSHSQSPSLDNELVFRCICPIIHQPTRKFYPERMPIA
jgi:hypothetical protein